jgi:hypothetical protein
VETPEGNMPLTRLKYSWEAGMKIDLEETGSNDEDWCHPADKKDE